MPLHPAFDPIVWYNHNGKPHAAIVFDHQGWIPPPQLVSILVLESAGDSASEGNNFALTGIPWNSPGVVPIGEAGPVGATVEGWWAPQIPPPPPIVWYNDGGTARAAIVRDFGPYGGTQEPTWMSLLVLTPDGDFTRSVVTWRPGGQVGDGEAGPIGSIPDSGSPPMSPEATIGSVITYHNYGGQACPAIVVGYTQTFDGFITERCHLLVLGSAGDAFHINDVAMLFEYPQVGDCSPRGLETYVPPDPPSPTACVWTVIATGSSHVWDHTEAHCNSGTACDNTNLPPLPDERYRPGAKFYMPCVTQIPPIGGCKFRSEGGMWIGDLMHNVATCNGMCKTHMLPPLPDPNYPEGAEYEVPCSWS